MKRPAFIAAVAASLCAAAVSAPVMAADADDPERAEAAVALFDERLTEAGWTSTGPQPETEPQAEGESQYGECLDGRDTIVDNTGEHLDGETARAYSDQYMRGEAGDEDLAFATAAVITVDDMGLEPIESLVALLGDDEAGACMAALYEQDLGTDENEMEVTAEVTDDLGFGDQAGSMAFLAEGVDEEGEATSYTFTFAGVLIDGTLAFIVGGAGNEGDNEFDVVAELEAMAEALA